MLKNFAYSNYKKKKEKNPLGVNKKKKDYYYYFWVKWAILFYCRFILLLFNRFKVNKNKINEADGVRYSCVKKKIIIFNTVMQKLFPSL